MPSLWVESKGGIVSTGYRFDRLATRRQFSFMSTTIQLVDDAMIMDVTLYGFYSDLPAAPPSSNATSADWWRIVIARMRVTAVPGGPSIAIADKIELDQMEVVTWTDRVSATPA
jgi:hypothetical protein